MSFAKASIAGLVLSFVASPSFAQRAQDTLRLAINDQFPSLLRYHYTVDEASNFARRVYDELIAFDDHNKKIVPQLASAWRQVNATTIEFDLRSDLKFHNGNAFDADDIVGTLTFLNDPSTKVMNKERYMWIKTVEKLGPHKVRLTSTQPNAMALGLLSYVTPIVDKETFDTHQNKAEYGRLTPIGTGPYKVVELGTQGITVERYDGFKGNSQYTRAPIKRIRGIPIPDRQTQQAQLITGGVDILRNVEPDAAKDLRTRPGITATTVRSGYMVVFGFDAAGRSGFKPLTDQRVRRALLMAIDRDTIIKHIVPGGDVGTAEKMAGMCFASDIGCKINTPQPAYDPVGAKKLLAEAGYPNGFELEYSVFAPIKSIGEAIAGELLKIGVKTKVSPAPFSVYTKMRNEGQFQAFSVFYPVTTHPDVGTTLNVFFDDPRDYAKDPIIRAAMAEGMSELDPAKRADIYARAMDRNNEMSYVMAFSSLPTVYAHSADVKIERSQVSATEAYINDYMWK